MSRINVPKFPDASGQSPFINRLVQYLSDYLRPIQLQLNGVTEGSIAAITNAQTAAPTAGTYQQGDYIKNSQPTELGTAGSKYVVLGWVCTVAGTPGTWLQDRGLTGN
jgi:hypothetical protein